MTVFEIVGGVIMILMSIAIVALVALQESPKGGGMGSLTGGDSYYNKNQSRSLDSILSKYTKYLAVAFFVITILVYAGDVFLK